MVLSKDVKDLRKILNLKQRELAEKLGVSVGTIQNYEAGGVIPMNKQIMIEGLLSNARSINITDNSNITNTGITSGDVIIGIDKEIKALRKRIKELEEENWQLKKDKAILQEFVAFLQNKI